MSDPQRARILLIEDDPDDVWIMRNLLGDRWDGPYELIQVEMLSAGIRRCAEGGIDVVLLDLSLPDSQGLETFLVMQAHAGGVPIVVLTGYDHEQTAVTAVKAGAEDYLVKGQVDDNALVRSIRYAIERSRRHRAEQELQANTEEFRIAREIQEKLFPASAPSVPGFDIAGALHPARATAGDYFDYIPMLDGCLGIVLGDVSSHGMGPALLMAETRACLRALAQTYVDAGEILTRANRTLAADTHDFHFVTLTLARLDPSNASLVYAGAGQRAYLLDPSGEVTVLDSTSPPLGIDEEMVVPCAPEIILEPGQVVAMFSDGVTEAEAADHTHFGTQRALDVIERHRGRPAREIVEVLYEAICDFSRGHLQVDDITAVLVKAEPGL
jgi:sigma-B regulation protein RsbU (phosphoserine phosphatase)